VSSETDWDVLESFLGSDDSDPIRAQESWNENLNGSNTTGLSLMSQAEYVSYIGGNNYPGVNTENGLMYSLQTTFWTGETTLGDQNAKTVTVNTFSGSGNQNGFNGFNVRCVKTTQGCTDPDGCNYDAGFNIDDGSCDYSCLPCQGEDTHSYQGYEYDIVEIGDQCWFAENLRSTSYSNGDEIPGELDDSNWSATTLGARTVYGEGSSTVQSGSGDETLNLTNFGRLYNAYAVDDNRGLCPNDWHVPTHSDWADLEMELGMSQVEANATGWRGSDQGSQLKASSSDTPSWNGTNSSQFSGLPGGYRSYLGNMVSADLYGVFWCQEMNQKMLGGIYDQVYSWVYTEEHFNRGGYSVRCLKTE
jgi:uncharacterized protein (TIGR02145 family)